MWHILRTQKANDYTTDDVSGSARRGRPLVPVFVTYGSLRDIKRQDDNEELNF
jgi:hypothetical protein